MIKIGDRYSDDEDVKYAKKQILLWKLWSDQRNGRANASDRIVETKCIVCGKDFCYRIERGHNGKRSICSDRCRCKRVNALANRKKHGKNNTTGEAKKND